MILIQIDVTGMAEMVRAVGDFAEGMTDFSEVWPDVRDEFFAIEREQFESEGAQGDAAAWQPLSPHYAAWKDRNFGGMPILQRTGALMASLAGDAANVDMQSDSLTIGSSVAYAIYHQEGTSRMPARPVIDLTLANQTRLSRIIRDFALKRARDLLAAA